MEYANILKEINNGRIRPVYLLHGEETYLARQVENAVINAVLGAEDKKTCLTVLENEVSPAYLVGLIETAPFFGAKNVIVLRESNLLKSRKGATESETDDAKEKDEAGARLLGILDNMPEYSLVIFTVSGKADKRKKLYKTIEKKGAVVELNPPKNKDARFWVTEKLDELGKSMTPDGLEYFLGVLSMMPQISIGMINNELEKIALYTGKNKSITCRNLIDVMASVPEVNVFEMTEALSRKEIRTALALLNSQLSAGEHPLKILGLLAFHVRRLWQIKEAVNTGKNAKEVADTIKIHSFIAERLVKQSKGFSSQQLKLAMLHLAEADRGLKSGRADASILEKIMIDLCI